MQNAFRKQDSHFKDAFPFPNSYPLYLAPIFTADITSLHNNFLNLILDARNPCRPQKAFFYTQPLTD